MAVGYIKRDDLVRGQLPLGNEQGGRLTADEEVGDAPLRRRRDSDLAWSCQPRQRDFMVGLIIGAYSRQTGRLSAGEPAKIMTEEMNSRTDTKTCLQGKETTGSILPKQKEVAES